MAEFRLTPAANADLDGIAAYTKREHGEQQCAVYLDTLSLSFDRLAEHPGMGAACDHIRPGLRQHRLERHVVFYATRTYGVRIVRVLHTRMAHEEHDFPNDDS